MKPLLQLFFFVNLFFSLREFFAVSEYIEKTKQKGKTPAAEDYFEFWFALTLSVATFLVFVIFCFRQ